jgi:hypothetical protein
MLYDSPGFADELTNDLAAKWNEVIQMEYNRLKEEFGSRFFSIDPQALSNPSPAAVQWFADPAEPTFCIGEEVARRLSDWDVRGRHKLHNEYCEYRIIERLDSSGRMRPKRVQVTTELREYWVCIAKHDPTKLRAMIQDILGFEPSWKDLYGVDDPYGLAEEQREASFSTLVAGFKAENGSYTQPTGRLNTDNAVFMTHPINGLDDLLYIVMFGAKPYASSTPGIQATREQIFREFGVEHLACRHADPAAAMAAYGAAFNGQPVAFANPIGMYFISFTKDVFFYQGSPVPNEWIRWSRGKNEGLYQRLEFGPDDRDPAFLDDITVEVGASSVPLTGGFQLIQFIEVGPLVVVGDATPVDATEFVILGASSSPIKCNEANVCNSVIIPLREEYDRSQQMGRVSPRVMGRI